MDIYAPEQTPELILRTEIDRLEQQQAEAAAAMDKAADAGNVARVTQLQQESLALTPLIESANRRLQTLLAKQADERAGRRRTEVSLAAGEIEKALKDDVAMAARIDASLQSLINNVRLMIGTERSEVTRLAFDKMTADMPFSQMLEARRLHHHVAGQDRLILEYITEIIRRSLFPETPNDTATIPSLRKIYADRTEKLLPTVKWWRQIAQERLK